MTLTPTQQEKITALKNAMDRSFVNESDVATSFSDNPSDEKVASEKLVKDSLDSHTHTKSQITDFPTEAKFITGAFSHINSDVITANTSETTPTGGDRFYVHITDTSISTTDARISVIYNNQYNVNGATYRNGTALKPNELKEDTILLIELVYDNGTSWNIIEAFNGSITKEQSYPIVETLNTKLGDEWAYVVSEVIHSGKKALCKITNLSSSELSSNDKIYIKIPSYQTDSNSATHIQLSDISGTNGILMSDTNNQTIKESDINGKIIYVTFDGAKFIVSNIYSTNRLMALISELPTKTSDLQNDGDGINAFLTQHQSLTNYIQKSQTSGLLKNDGSIDTNTYLTSSAISGMLTTSDTVDNLTTNDATKPLSAKQGKALNDMIGSAITYIVGSDN